MRAAIGPTLAAFLITAFTEGKLGVKALWRRFWNRNLSIKWLLVTLLGFEVLKLLANLAVRTIDGQPYPIIDTANPFSMTITVFLATFISSGMGEEFGWRGYVLTRLQAKWNALTSSIVLGLLWAAWHIPAFITPNVSPLYQRNFWEWLPMVLFWFSVKWTRPCKKVRVSMVRNHVGFLPKQLALLPGISQFLLSGSEYDRLALLELVPRRHIANG